jgi:spore germination protein YaaH
MILKNPVRFGFEFTDQDLYPPLAFERVQIECFQDTPVQIVAQAANTYFKAIKDLNPEIRGHFLAAGTHSLLIPPDSAEGFDARFKKLVQEWQAKNLERIYVVQKGDSLTGIAERFKVPLPALLIWNRLDGRKPIHPGDRLVIYPNETMATQKDSSDRNQ